MLLKTYRPQWKNSLRDVTLDIFDRIFTIDRLLVGDSDKKEMLAACKKIEDEISSDSQVYYKGDLRYFDDIRHYSVSSTTYPACCVEPATASDLSIIVRKWSIHFLFKNKIANSNDI